MGATQGGVSHEEVAAILNNLQNALEALQHRVVETGLRQLPSLKREELPAFLSSQREHVAAWAAEQLREWPEAVAAAAAPASAQAEECAAATPPAPGSELQPEYGAHMQSLEKRLAAMGGIPALGGVVLPRLTPAAKAGLQPTASPAAKELRREAAATGNSPSLPAVEASPVHRFQLRKTPTDGSVGISTAGAALSELEAALQKRKGATS